MYDNMPDAFKFPKLPEGVREAERKLQAEAPALYQKIARFRNCQSWRFYETAKFYLERSGLSYEDWIKTVTEFLNV